MSPDVAPLAPRAAQNVFKVVSLSGETMGTTWSVKVAVRGDAPERDLRRVIETCLARVIAQMSQWEPNSDVSRFNRAPAGTWQLLPEEFCRVLQHALELAGDSNGAYDPTIGALSDLWGFGSTGRRQVVPDNSAIMRSEGAVRLATYRTRRRAARRSAAGRRAARSVVDRERICGRSRFGDAFEAGAPRSSGGDRRRVARVAAPSPTFRPGG